MGKLGKFDSKFFILSLLKTEIKCPR